MTIDYAALADTIKIEDITSDETNQEILHKLKDNDERFDKLYIMDDNGSSDDVDYIPDEGEDLGWLGYFIGNNKKLHEIHFYKPINESFYQEISHNKSIKKMHFNGNSSLDGDKIRMLGPFLKNNNNLSDIDIESCQVGAEGIRQLSLAISDCNQSLKHFSFRSNEIGDGHLVEIITALSMHPQLTQLDLSDNDGNGASMGRNVCTALATLLRCT